MTDAAPKAASADFREEALPHMDAVFRFALRLSGNKDEAEDLVQETFLRAYRSWAQYTPGTRCKSWLFTICRNVFLRQRERGRRHEEIVTCAFVSFLTYCLNGMEKIVNSSFKSCNRTPMPRSAL